MTRRLRLAVVISTIAFIALISLTSFTYAAQDSLYAWSDANNDFNEHDAFKADVDAASEWRIMTTTGATGISGTGGTGTTGATGGTAGTGGTGSNNGGTGWTAVQCKAAINTTLQTCQDDANNLRCTFECGFIYSEFYVNCILPTIVDLRAFTHTTAEYADFYSTCSMCTYNNTLLVLESCGITPNSTITPFVDGLRYPTTPYACNDYCGYYISNFESSCLVPSYGGAVPASYTAYTQLCRIEVPRNVTSFSLLAVSDTELSMTWDRIVTANPMTAANVFYVIERADSLSTSFVYNGATPYFLDSGLQANTTYVYRIRAFNSAGNGSFTDYHSMKTLLVGPASPASIHSEDIGVDYIVVSWTPVVVENTTVFYQVSVDGVPMWFGTETETTLTSLYAFTSYIVSVTASTAGSAFSAPSSVTIRTIDAVPSKVQFLPVSQQSVAFNAITLRWSTPDFCGGATTCDQVTYYIFTNASNSTTNTSVVGQTSVTFDCLNYTTTYQFTIVAENSVGLGQISDVFFLTTPATVPQTPTNLTLLSVGANSFTIGWSTDINDGGNRILGALLIVIANGLQLANSNIEVNFWTTQYTFTDLPANTRYEVVFITRNQIGYATNPLLSYFQTLIPPPNVQLFSVLSPNGLNINTTFTIVFDQLVAHDFPVSTKADIDALIQFVPSFPASDYLGAWSDVNNNTILTITIPENATITVDNTFYLGFAYVTFLGNNLIAATAAGSAPINTTYHSPALSGGFYLGVANVFSMEVYPIVTIVQDSVNNSLTLEQYTSDIPSGFETFTLQFSVLGQGNLSVSINATNNYTLSDNTITIDNVNVSTLVQLAAYVQYTPTLYARDNAAIVITAIGASSSVQTIIPITIQLISHPGVITYTGSGEKDLPMGGSVQIGPFLLSDVDDFDGHASYVVIITPNVTGAYLMISSIPVTILPYAQTGPNVKLTSISVRGTLAALSDFSSNYIRYYDDLLSSTTDNAAVEILISDILSIPYIEHFNPVCTGAPPPDVVGARFCNDYSCFRVIFETPVDINSISSAECSDYFAADTVAKFGNSPRCAFQSSTQLYVYFGSNPTLMPKDTVEFAATNDVRRCSVAANAVGTFVVDVAEQSLAPTVSISGLQHVGLCDEIDLYTTTRNTGGRPVKYSWFSNVISVLPYLPETGSTSSVLSISNQNLVAGSTYLLTVTIKDFLNRTASASYTVSKGSSPIPIVQFAGTGIYSQTASDQFTVQVTPVLNTCASDRRMEFTWSLRNSTGDLVPISSRANGKPSIIFAPHQLNAIASPYSLVLLTSMTSQPDLYSTTEFTIYVSGTPLVLLMQGGSSRSQSWNSTLQVAARVIDYDNSADTVSYSWSCATAFGAACTDSATGAALLPFGNSNAISIPPLTLAVGTYVFSVSAQKSGRVAYASSSVTIVRGWVPSVSINTRSLTIGPSDVLRLRGSVADNSDSSLTYSWSVVQGVLDLTTGSTSPNAQTLIVNPTSSSNYFIGGTVYIFRLSVTSENATGYADVTITIRTPPSGGVVSVSPSSGVALLTDFTWATSGWTSANTLTYTFYTVNNGVYRQQSRGAPTAGGRLGASDSSGSTTFVVKACDNYGVCSEASTTVQVSAATASITNILSLVSNAVDECLQTSDVGSLMSLLRNLLDSYAPSTPTRRLLQSTSVTDVVTNVFNNPAVVSLLVSYSDKTAVFSYIQQYSQTIAAANENVRDFGMNAQVIEQTLQNYQDELSGGCDDVLPEICQARRVILDTASNAIEAALNAVPAATTTNSTELLSADYLELINILDQLYVNFVLSSSSGDVIDSQDSATFSNTIRSDDASDDVIADFITFPALTSAVDSSNNPISGTVATTVAIISQGLINTFVPLSNMVNFQRTTSSGDSITFTSTVPAIEVAFTYSASACDGVSCDPVCRSASNSSMIWDDLNISGTNVTVVSDGVFGVTCTLSGQAVGTVALGTKSKAVNNDNSSSDNTLAIGLGVGLGVGGGLIIIAALAYFFIVRKSQTVVPSGNTETLTSSV